MRKLPVLIVSICVLALGAESAFAVPGDPGEPILQNHDASLTVTPPPTGMVTGTGISCPGDCFEELDYEESCERLAGCTPVDGPAQRTLTASRGPGWTANWTGCTTATGNTCDIDVVNDETVSLTWTDTANPTVGLSSPAAVAGPSTLFTASASDNAGVQRVDFYVDNVLRGTDTSFPFQAGVDLALFAHGSAHTLKVIAVDTSGRSSTNLASAPGHDFTVDKQTELTDVSTVSALVGSAPAVSFTRPADATASGVTCRTKLGTTVIGTQVTCGSPYTAQMGATPADGDYSVELTVTDQVGNTATVSRTFELDKTAPVASITGGPANGAVIDGRSASFNFSGTDANGVTFTCRLDSGPYTPCSGVDSHALNNLTPGPHAFTLRAQDGAGNATEATRNFTVAAPAGTPSGNDGQNGRDGRDGAQPGGQPEPTVRLASVVRAVPKWKVRGGKTRVRRLSLAGLVPGARVQVSCKGKGCPFKKKTRVARGATLNLTKLFKKRSLRAGTRITIRVSFADGSVRTFTYVTRKGKKKPKPSIKTA